MGLAYWGLAQKIWIIIEGVECQLLKVVSHQRGSAVEEGLQFLWVLIAWHLFPFVSLVKHYLDFGKPSWKKKTPNVFIRMAQFYESGSFCPVYMHVYGTYMYCKLILIACGKTFEMFAENLSSQIFFNIT